jgi:hypothetical protein
MNVRMLVGLKYVCALSRSDRAGRELVENVRWKIKSAGRWEKKNRTHPLCRC